MYTSPCEYIRNLDVTKMWNNSGDKSERESRVEGELCCRNRVLHARPEDGPLGLLVHGEWIAAWFAAPVE